MKMRTGIKKNENYDHAKKDDDNDDIGKDEDDDHGNEVGNEDVVARVTQVGSEGRRA